MNYTEYYSKTETVLPTIWEDNDSNCLRLLTILLATQKTYAVVLMDWGPFFRWNCTQMMMNPRHDNTMPNSDIIVISPRTGVRSPTNCCHFESLIGDHRCLWTSPGMIDWFNLKFDVLRERKGPGQRMYREINWSAFSTVCSLLVGLVLISWRFHLSKRA